MEGKRRNYRQKFLFSDIEIKVLRTYAKKKLKSPDCLGDMVELVAIMGGYLSRKNDPPPGHQLMWRGYAHLQIMCEGFLLKESCSGDE